MEGERRCIDPHCADRVEGSSLRPLSAIFALVGVPHLALFWRFGAPGAQPFMPAMFWFFVAICWLFVNSAATIAIYAAYVFAFEQDSHEFIQWLRHATAIFRAIAQGSDLPAPPKSSSSPK